MYKRQVLSCSPQRQIQKDVTSNFELCGHVSSGPAFNHCQGSFTAGLRGTFGVHGLCGSLWRAGDVGVLGLMCFSIAVLLFQLIMFRSAKGERIVEGHTRACGTEGKEVRCCLCLDCLMANLSGAQAGRGQLHRPDAVPQSQLRASPLKSAACRNLSVLGGMLC